MKRIRKKGSKFDCNICLKHFESFNALVQHAEIKKHKTLVCIECSKYFDSLKALKQHKYDVHKPNSRRNIKIRFNKRMQILRDKRKLKSLSNSSDIFIKIQCDPADITSHEFVIENFPDESSLERCIHCGKTRMDIEKHKIN